MSETLATAQTIRYADELRSLYRRERTQRRQAEGALAMLEESHETTVRALASALELRDDQTGGHTRRVTELALRLTERVAPELGGERELRFGFLLHDLGKIGVPDVILLKPGPLSAAELEQMRRHPLLGERLLAGIPYLSDLARAVVGAHHERWDGTGYPRRLAGERIPLGARIFALADVFDAMTHDRPYRRALPVERVLEEIAAGSGGHFDPELVPAFLDLAHELGGES